MARAVIAVLLLTWLAGVCAGSEKVTLSCDREAIDNRNLPITFTVHNAQGEPVTVCIEREVEAEGETRKVLVKRIRCKRNPAGQWQAAWYGKDDTGLDVPNGVYYARPAGDSVTDYAARKVAVERSSVISNLRVSPNPFWPVDADPGEQVSERKAVIKFVLSRPSLVTVGVFPENVDPQTEPWNKAIRIFDLSEVEPGEVVVTWDGKLQDGKTMALQDKDKAPKKQWQYAVGVKAVDLKDKKRDPDEPRNVVIETCSLVLKRIPFIEDLVCVPATFSPDGDGINDVTQIQFWVDTPGADEGQQVTVAASIFNEKGENIASFPGTRVEAGKKYTLQWDGRGGRGALRPPATEAQPREADTSREAPLSDGSYLVRLFAMDESRAEAIPKVTKVEVKRPVPLRIELFVATPKEITQIHRAEAPETQVEADAEAGGTPKQTRRSAISLQNLLRENEDELDNVFWEKPDKGILPIEFVRTRRLLTDASEIAEVPLPVILPLQDYIPWVRFKVSKQSSVILEVYSLAGGKIGNTTFGTAPPGTMSDVKLGRLSETLRNNTKYRGVLLATDTESPVTVKEEFFFKVYKAPPPKVASEESWLILSNTHGNATVGSLPVGKQIDFEVQLDPDSQKSEISVQIFRRSQEGQQEGGDPIWQSETIEVDTGNSIRILWNGQQKTGAVPQGQYRYVVSAVRVDPEAQRLQKMMPGLRLQSQTQGERLWVVSLPEVKVFTDPADGEFSPDGVSPAQAITLNWESTTEGLGVTPKDLRQIHLSGAIKEPSKNETVYELASESEKPRIDGSWKWEGESKQGDTVPDGKYVIEWLSTCKRTREVPGSEGKTEDVTFHLPVKPTQITVDRKPVIFELGAKPDRISPDGDGKLDVCAIGFSVGDDSSVSARVESPSGIRQLAAEQRMDAGTHTLTWDGKTDDGHYADKGTARLVFSSEDAEGNTSTGAFQISILSHFAEMAPPIREVSSVLQLLGEHARSVEIQRRRQR